MRVRASGEEPVPWRSLVKKHEFMYKSTSGVLSPVRRAAHRVHCAMVAPKYNDYETIDTWLQHAVRDNNLAAARYLLAAGLPPTAYDHFGIESLVALCVRRNMPEMGALLRKHGARLPGYARREAQNMVDYFNHPSRIDVPWQVGDGKLWESLISPDEDACAQVPTYEHSLAAVDYLDTYPKAVTPSWPPRGVLQHPPPESLLPPPTHLAILDLWHVLGIHRRAEAKALAPRNWARVRSWLRVRAIAHYWQGVTQERQCAPGGQGRAADLVAYRAEFA